MSDSHDRKGPEDNDDGQAGFEASVDELTRRADDLVDALMIDDESPTDEVRAVEDVVDAGPEDEAAPPETREPGDESTDDGGEDIEARLDTLFGFEGDPVPVTEGPEAEVAAAASEPTPVSEELPPELEPVSEIEMAEEEASAEFEPEPAPDLEAVRDESTPAIEEDLALTDTPPAVLTPPPTQGFRPSWMIAAAVLLAALAGGVWLTVFQDSSTASDPEIADATLKILQLQQASAAEVERTAAPAPAQPSAVEQQEDVPPTIEVASVVQVEAPAIERPRAVVPDPEPPVAVVEPPRRVAPDPEPPAVVTTAPLTPDPEPRTIAAVEVPTPAMPEPAPATVPDPAPSMLAPATTIEVATPELPAASNQPLAFPTVTGFQPPEVLDRREPVWPESVTAGGYDGAIVLKVLVSEKGRAVRVIVEESVRDTSIEAAAINAVLHWTYAPAMDEGRPVRSWAMERFEF